MGNVQHTATGSTAPTGAPPSVGAHYTDTVAKKTWIASGTDSVFDWGVPLPGAHRVVPDSVFELTLDVDVPLTIWKMDSYGGRTIKLPRVTKPGVWEMVLVLETTIGADRFAKFDIEDANQKLALIEDAVLISRRISATHFRISCFQGDNMAISPARWKVLEEIHYTNPPVRYSELTDTDINIASTLFLSDEMPRTVWSWTLNGGRTLVLPRLGETFSPDFYSEFELIVWNQTVQQQTITMDTVSGMPLVDHATLDVPGNSCVVFKLAHFIGAAKHRWTLVGTHTL